MVNQSIFCMEAENWHIWLARTLGDKINPSLNSRSVNLKEIKDTKRMGGIQEMAGTLEKK